MTEFICVLFAAIIMALVKFLFEYVEEKQFEKDLTAPDQVEILKNDDEINRYMDYFEKNIGKPYTGCRIPRKTIKKLKSSYDNNSTLEAITSVLLQHIELFPPYITVKINKLSNSTNAGEYSNTFIPKITVNLKEEFTYINVLAILCHECTHHFMHKHGIQAPNIEDNEKMTDALAVYLGFGKYIKFGYATIKQLETKSYSFSTNSTINYKYNIRSIKIGYLDESKVDYAIGKVKRLRKKYWLLYAWDKVNFIKKIHKSLENAQTDSIEQLKGHFDEIYSIYCEIINRHKEIADIIVSKKISSMDMKDVKIMQDYLSDYFELHYVDKALEIKNQTESQNIEKKVLKRYISQLTELSAQLTEINVRLSKYL